ncbi:hypothetical protein BCR43DRAFT_476231 [Syncephalastrum racemosum]|uniref:Uncharacterized protein n=1 Tax=Syncephalastrum racemosum TaxID=13706 RepID=A0A1X2H7E7_SYNRA|nr:hypothetical protein BCR43DRAFT_476231 [Syncephalastrum racemosum]
MLRTTLLGLTKRISSPTATLIRPFSSRPDFPFEATPSAEAQPKVETEQQKDQPSAEKNDQPPMDFLTSETISPSDLRITNETFNSLEQYQGRSIGNVTNTMSAYYRLNAILKNNNVRKELRANRHYEKPTVARRRKNIERNRKLFGAMVSKKVALIMQMKQRGM